MTAAATAADSDTLLGRAAAERLAHDWPDLHDLDERDSLEFANAAIERLAELIDSQPKLFKASRDGSQRGAETLSARRFQGVLESIQNADDLGATELRLAIRKRGKKRELLVVHNGAPVSLVHVGAMVLPWVSTKADDPSLSGRFGIGQMTLLALGGPIDAHCHPYHFRIGAKVPVVVAPEPSIPDIYSEPDRETLLVVHLDSEVDLEELETFVRELGARALAFLRSVRRLVLIDADTGRILIDHFLRERSRRAVQLAIRGKRLDAELVELFDRDHSQKYTRYMVEMPLRPDERRHNKATGPTTTLGVVIPGRPERGQLYDRVPIPAACELSVGLNAQFDPDTARSTLHENNWNARRFAELGYLVASAALDVNEEKSSSAWNAMPLQAEVPKSAGKWLHDRYEDDVIKRAQQRLADELELGAADERSALSEIVFEEALLDGILTTEDQEQIAPGYTAVAPTDRDRAGRWRSVLEELGRSRSIEVIEALELLEQDDDELGKRDVDWFVQFAAAAVDADCFEEFCDLPGVLLADGRRVRPPRRNEPKSLVLHDEPSSLASRLGAALPLAQEYLGGGKNARKVRSALEEEQLLAEAYTSDEDALRLLARGSGDAVRLDDDALVALRDAVERLSDEDQRTLGPRIGRAIELRGYSYDEAGKAGDIWVSPSAAYLPAQIDRETESFARAAANTPEIAWLHPDYAQLLRRSDRRALGTQRLLVRLGAQTFPRLVAPPDERQVYQRDRRRVSTIQLWTMPDLQATEIRSVPRHTTHLIGDKWSPDLDAVIADITEDRSAKSRRRRAKALLGLIVRGWDRHFADHVTAQAAWGTDGYWYPVGEVVSTWLARAATEPWLPSATGALRPPSELHLSTDANRLTVGDKKSAYLMPVDDYIARSQALPALRLRRGPSASSVVARLEALRDSGKRLTQREQEQVGTAYRLLALACPRGDGRAASRPVDDLTVAALRSHFAGSRGSRGLILSGGEWYGPDQVFRGPPIFGVRRPFVPQSQHLDQLWLTLGVEPPDARDCLEVLRELGDRPLGEDDVAVVIESMALVAAELNELSPQLRARMKTLPLWIGSEWRSSRPVYAVDDETVAGALRAEHPVWKPGFAFDRMLPLLDALDITYIAPDQFIPVAAAGYGAAEGNDLRPQFVRAVDHLRNELARSDQELSKTLTRSWEELAATTIVMDDELAVAASVSGRRRLVAPTTAHLVRHPLTLFARSADDVGSADAGGRAIAALFDGDRQKVAWAWAVMWQRAEVADVEETIVLSTDAAKADEDDDRLAKLQTQADDRRQRGAGKGGKQSKGGAAGGKTTKVKVKQLKSLSGISPSTGDVVNKGATQPGVLLPPSRNKKLSDGTSRKGGNDKNSKRPPSRSVLPPMTEREQLAYDAVKLALALDDRQIRDLRDRRGVGADAVDELKQWFEIKMSSGPEYPAEITLTPSEIERAKTDPDFFLAIVAGLEDSAGKLRVRFIFDPLRHLPLQLRSDLTFGGVRDAEALEYVFEAPATPDTEGA